MMTYVEGKNCGSCVGEAPHCQFCAQPHARDLHYHARQGPRLGQGAQRPMGCRPVCLVGPQGLRPSSVLGLVAIPRTCAAVASSVTTVDEPARQGISRSQLMGGIT